MPYRLFLLNMDYVNLDPHNQGDIGVLTWLVLFQGYFYWNRSIRCIMQDVLIMAVQFWKDNIIETWKLLKGDEQVERRTHHTGGKSSSVGMYTMENMTVLCN